MPYQEPSLNDGTDTDNSGSGGSASTPVATTTSSFPWAIVAPIAAVVIIVAILIANLA